VQFERHRLERLHRLAVQRVPARHDVRMLHRLREWLLHQRHYDLRRRRRIYERLLGPGLRRLQKWSDSKLLHLLARL
jgi:hypothetical protein